MKNLVEEEQTVDTKDDEDTMVAGDGHIVIPDCCCSVCHKYVGSSVWAVLPTE